MAKDKYEYSVTMDDGEVVKLTKEEIMRRTGYGEKLIGTRLRRGWRDWNRLSMTPAEGARRNRAKMRALLTAEQMEREAAKRRKMHTPFKRTK